MPQRRILRINALRKFQVEYFHGIRNGKSSEEASTDAFLVVRDYFLSDLYVGTLQGVDREEEWGKVLEVLMEWRILLKGIPIDASKIPAKGEIAQALANDDLVDPSLE